ncbi:MAG: hypothetical protein HRT64_03130 [Erythrobacter sp.]|nr:hypothetical protein [Erythrobacter sp.]
MSHEKTPPPNQVVHLSAGAHAVINGALVSSREACTLEVGAGAYVLTGRALWPAHSAPRNPCDELYFSLLDCVADEERFFTERFRLFALLGEVAAQGALYERQRECSQCAAALMAGDAKAALQCAARMASSRMEEPQGSIIGDDRPRERRRAHSRGI